MTDAPVLDRRYPRLPPARLENARVLTDCFDLLRYLPLAGAVAMVGDTGLLRYIQEICPQARPFALQQAGLAAQAYESLDVVFLDAARDVASVSGDLVAINRVLKPDGMVVVAGYAPVADGGLEVPCGVIQAVHDFMMQADFELAYLALAPAMNCHVALRRIGIAQSILSIQQENTALRASLEEMRQSRSWRMTALLRYFRK